MKLRIHIESVPRLLIGDKGSISDALIKKGEEETRRVKGVITFQDGSKTEGTREIIFGDPVLRIGEDEVEGMFLPNEYFSSKKEDQN